MHFLVLAASVLVTSCAHGQNPVMSCRMQDQYHVSGDQHSAGVDARGDHAMGFSHETTAHHFCILPDGGMISIRACGRTRARTASRSRSL